MVMNEQQREESPAGVIHRFAASLNAGDVEAALADVLRRGSAGRWRVLIDDPWGA
jgi:hypothetical protein